MSSKNDPNSGFKGIDLSLGGLFKGIGSFVDLINQLAEEDKDSFTKTGGFSGVHNGRGVRGQYGFTVRLGVGETSGHKDVSGHKGVFVHKDVSGPQDVPMLDDAAEFSNEENRNQEAVLEPVVDVLDEGPHLVVISELPGVTKDEISIEIDGSTLKLSAPGTRHCFRREVNLPVPAEPVPLSNSFKNGILELTLKKLAD